MHLVAFVSATVFGIGTVAIPLTHNHVVHEHQGSISNGWKRSLKLGDDVRLPVRIGLTQGNAHRGYDLLMDVSRAGSPNYGKYYTADEVIELFKPSDDAVDSVKAWLVDSGIGKDRISQSSNKQWIQFDGSVKELEDLLHTEYYVFEHEKSGLQDVATEKYHVPSVIRQHVDYITPGIRLHGGRWGGKAKLRKRSETGSRKNPANFRSHHTPPQSLPEGVNVESLAEALQAAPLSKCDSTITPDCIRALYNITVTRKVNSNNSFGIFEDLGDKYDQDDLNSFYAKFATSIPKGTGPIVHLVDGATAPVAKANAGAESLLDFSIAIPLVYPQGVQLFQTDDDQVESNYIYGGFFNNFLDAIDGSYCPNDPIDPQYPDPLTGGYTGQLQCGVFQAPNVISVSYGGDEQGFPPSYAIRQCNEYMKLGLQGVTVVFSSGDSGVGSNDGCLVAGTGTNGYNFTASSDGTIFNPSFGATCPYVTSVGSTVLPTGADVKSDAEIATTRFPSGGGFSNVFATPDYQASAVSGYLNTYQPIGGSSSYKYYETVNGSAIGENGGIYNRAGRGHPDIAASGDNIVIYYQGSAQLIGGTSASAPIVASMITLINEQRLNAGKPPVGFINPTLYQHPEVFHDITKGTNANCNTQGFSATKGWDPVSGLGTPNFPSLLNVLLNQ